MPSSFARSYLFAQALVDVISCQLYFALEILYCKIVMRASAVVVDASELDLGVSVLAAYKNTDCVKRVKTAVLVGCQTVVAPILCRDSRDQ